MIAPVFPSDESEGNPLLADLLSRYPLHRVSDFCSIILERHGASEQPRANPLDVRREAAVCPSERFQRLGACVGAEKPGELVAVDSTNRPDNPLGGTE